MKIKVLLVDDEKDFVDAMGERLKIRDFNVTIAYSGKSALEMIKKVDFDVIVLDVMMPEMTGTQALKEIKDINPLLQVLMLTGAASVENAIEGMKLGAYDFLMKPASADDLAEKIKAARQIKAEHDDRIRNAEISKIVKTKGW